MIGKVLIIGGGIGGMEASLNLVEAGFKVYLSDRKPNIGGNMAQLDKIFPTNDCSMCVMAPKLVEVGRNPNIELLMNSEVVRLEGEPGNFIVTLRTRPRRVMPDRCTSCTACAQNCPVEVGDVYNEELSLRSAAFVNFPQAIPSTYMIDRQMAPCIYACPVHLNARDYIGLIAEGRFIEAIERIRETIPFPGIIGRICAHPCEDACLRGRQVDRPLAICALKRFVADYELGKREIPVPDMAPPRGKKVAVIGGGPAGISCAYELRKKGYDITVFDAYDKLGGMLYVGVPAYRLPKDVLERELSVVEMMGVHIRYNTRVGRDISLEEIFDAFDATFISSGAHGRRVLGIPNETAGGVLNALNFLRDVNMGNTVEIGKRVVVMGGGNVAMDAALTAKRCGGTDIHIVALERWEDMPAHRWEIDQAMEERIVIHNSWGPQAIHATENRVTGVELQRCTRVYDAEGMFDPLYDGTVTTHFDIDTLILVIYETIDTAYLAESGQVELMRDGRVRVDRVTLETSRKGVFAGGNVVTGPRTAIDAIAQGRQAAESVERYLEGRDLKEGRLAEDDKILDVPAYPVEKRPRTYLPKVPPGERRGFEEINIVLDEQSAIEEAKRCLSCRRCLGCKICSEACKPEAINYDEGPVEQVLRVGSIIVSCGYDEFDALQAQEFGYKRYKNVLTSVEYERILSATGPTRSIVMRPSDGKVPKKIAFIQCVGSRNHINEYCSAVCCMYATEEAIISREHHHDIEPTIFYIDIRTFGKGYEEHFERARREYGVRYIKSHISMVLEDPATKDIEITYIDQAGRIQVELFDLVVLAVGLGPSKQLKGLAGIMGIELNRYGFLLTGSGGPLTTSLPGVFACGACESPKDITETVIDGSASACEASSFLAASRWKEITERVLPAERDVSGEEPRIGVFICNCGVNIGGIVDVPGVKRYAEGLEDVVFSDENLFTCSHDTQEKIKRMIEEHNLNRVVVASCSTRTHEPLFRALVREKGLNPYLFEMANIRDQCSWVHMRNKEEATAKAKDLVRMAVANARHMIPVEGISVQVTRATLVVGGGITGMTAALNLADQGVDVFLVEREHELGGNLHHIFTTVDGMDVSKFLMTTVGNVMNHPLIHVRTACRVLSSAGTRGKFETTLRAEGSEATETVRHGTTILATGGEEYKPFGLYGYGEDARVMTQNEFEKALSLSALPHGNRCVMIQCVGSRNEQRPYCSRICCTTAIKNALTLRRLRPESEITVFFRDVMTYGFLEQYYLKARELGVRFIRYEADTPPQLERAEDGLAIRGLDTSIMEQVELGADFVVLSCAVVPRGNGDMAGIFKVPRTREGFFFEAHMKLKPIDVAVDGIYIAGMCHSPKNIRESMIQAEGACARAMTTLSKESLLTGGVVACVDDEKCAACLSCVRVCPYSVPVINDEGRAQIDVVQCKGCGTCVAECPAKAIDLKFYRDVQIIEKAGALVAGKK